MNQKLFTRIFALLLVFAMLLGLVPLAFAEEGSLGSGTPDGEPPQLLSIELSATTVSAPNTIEVIAEATDDVSGIDYLNMRFYCEETGKYIAGDASAYYWDHEKNDRVRYPDGKLHGEIYIDQYLESGAFVLYRIEICDLAGNSMTYIHDYDSKYNDAPNFGPIPNWFTQREIRIVSNDQPDGTPPVLTNLTLETTDIIASKSIEITAEATDNVSGVDFVYLRYYCEETGKSIAGDANAYYWDYEKDERVRYPDGKLHGEIYVDQYLESGTFVLYRVEICDLAGNSIIYIQDYDSKYSDSPNYAPIPEWITQREIRVTDCGTPDGTPPILTGMQIAATTVAAPSTIEFTAEATDDVAGADCVYLRFYCEKTGKYISGDASAYYWDYDKDERVRYPDGKLHGEIHIDQYLESGTFVLNHLQVDDSAGNYRIYLAGYSFEKYGGLPDYAPIPDFVTQREITVLNAIPDVTTNIAKPEFVDEIANAKDDAYIKADFSGEAELPETAFDAIAGTDKTLDLVSDGVTWRFNGNDIVNDSKPIDLNVNISKLDEDEVPVADEISEKLDEAPAVVMKFAENGVLPGKATIQIKVDYAMREYLGASRELNVYYFNNQTGELELIAENLMVVNDTYVEFPITHCSYYVLTHAAAPQEHVHAPEKVEFMDATHEADGYEEHYACACGVLFADAEGTKVITEEDIRIARYELGDVDHDHRLTSMDAMLLMQYKAGLLPVDFAFCTECADVDGKMGINSMDAMLILQFRAGLIESFR